MTALAPLLFAASALLPPESFVREADGTFRCDLAKLGVPVESGELRSGGWSRSPRYPALYFGGEPQTLAREPDGGWFTFEGKDNVVVENLPANGYSLAGYWTHDWAFEVLRVASVENGRVRFADRHEFGIGESSWGQKKRRFYAVNHRSFLDAPGEWVLDGKSLLFIPPGGDVSARPVTLAWGDDPVLLLEHRRGETLRGRTIAFGGGAGLVLRDCHDVLIADCTVECVAGTGIEIGADCTGVVVSNCVVRNVGGRGVVLNGGDRKRLAKGGNRVVGCDIHRFALVQRVYAPGVALGGCGNEIVGCRIHDAPHSAIIYGGNEHLIADNDVFDVVKETGDAGALYTGRDWTSRGNVVARNHIHDLGQTVSNGRSHDVFTMGVYLDDCDCGDAIVSNVFERAGCAVMIGGGRENAVVGNRIADCDIAVHLDDRGVTWTNHWNNPNDPSWNLVKKAEDLGYRSEPWASRYPKLAKTMDDEPRLPKYNVFADNEVIHCRIPWQFHVFDAIWAHAKDGAADSGVALSALVEKHDAERARAVAKSLLRRRPGANPTPFVHGLFRYHESGMASAEEKAEIRGAFAALADAMTADGAKAQERAAHEAAAVPMVYAAAWKTSGDARFREAYEKCADAAIDESWGVSKMTEAERAERMPARAFLDMNSALEVVRMADKSRANRAEAVMKEVALLAARRFVAENGAGAAGDLACAVSMISKVESIGKVLGPELNAQWERLVVDCINGLDGQPPLWESAPERVFPLLSAKFRLGELSQGAAENIRPAEYRPDHAWMWRRSGANGDAPFRDGVVELRHNDAQDWSLNCFPRMDVRPGDHFVFEFDSAKTGGPDGTIRPCVVTRRADGEVANWAYASVPVKPGEHGRTEFVVPYGVASVEPRFIGEGPVAAKLSHIVVRRLGNVIGKNAGCDSPFLTFRSGALEVSVSPRDASLAVKDLRTGRVWTPAASDGGFIVTETMPCAGGPGVSVWCLDAASMRRYQMGFGFKDGELEVTVWAQPDEAMPRPLDFPAAFATRKGDRLVIPMNEGIGLPVDEQHPGLWREPMYSGHGLCMPFFGVVEDATGAGWMALVETPDDAAMQTRRTADGLLVAGPSWDSQHRRFGYVRRMRYVFFDKGGHVAMAKRYRAYAKEKGLLVTFAEKAKARARVLDLVGAPNVWCWGSNEKLNGEILGEIRGAGAEKVLWSAGGSPAFVKKLAGMEGVLIGRYDIYQDIMDPKHREELPYWHNDWVTEAFPQDIMWSGPSPEQWTHGWPVEAKKGPRIDCAVMCDRQALPYARRRIGAELKEKPFNARFIDTTTASPWRECWNPAHPMTRTESREWKMKLLAVVSDEFGLVCGSETGHDAAVPYCDYFEGMLSLGPYRIDEAGRDMWRTIDEVPERVAKYQVGERYRLPLWELVYHDCCVAQWYWGDYNNKLPATWRKRDLFNALYATPPMYLFHAHDWRKWRDRVLASVPAALAGAKAAAGTEMVDHRFLSADRSVQQTLFANGAKVTVDFAAGTAKVE